ncbi:MAG: KR domain-containing protein, partial [Pseudomonadales bacterium]
IQTACSSALVAIHYAVASLLADECDLALAGASTVLLPQGRGYWYREGEIMSPDGHCRPFDAQSAGTIFGSGAGAVVLRRLEDALLDGDQIHAVIRGSAINNDGAQKVGFLAPGVEGQAAVISEALELAGVEPADVGYVEAHGTGTLVGDPIEMAALKEAFGTVPPQTGRCLVSSVKSNIGHLGEAAGIASFIKAVLALKHGQIPPTPNFRTPNPDMDIEESPFAVSTELTDWAPRNGTRVCGITALGAGGTNAHVVIEEAPQTTTPESSAISRAVPLLLSARSRPALHMMAARLSAHLAENPATRLLDAGFTLSAGRRAYEHRAVVIAEDCAAAALSLDHLSGDQNLVRCPPDNPQSLIFMFPGGGAQYAGMGAGLYRDEPVYREAFEQALQALPDDEASTIRRLVVEAAQYDPQALKEVSRELESPKHTLVALFATEYALAMLLKSWGAEPDAFVGHSMGEYTAACLAGVMSVANTMALVRKRGELFARVPAGAMLSVSVSAEQLRQRLPAGLDIAAVNAPDLCVASGPVELIADLEQALSQENIDCTRIHIDVAAHSSMLDEIVAEFRTFCQGIAFESPQIPFTSNLTGAWITPEQAMSPDYWADHLRNTVQFAANIETVRSGRSAVYVEVGPGRTLTSLSKACGIDNDAAYGSMRHPNESKDDGQFALRTLAGIWASGAVVDWSKFWPDAGAARVTLPGYPFERQRYWIEPGQTKSTGAQLPVMSKRVDLGEWFGMPSWNPSGRVKPKPTSAEQWLLFAASKEQAALLLPCLPGTAQSPETIVVFPAKGDFQSASATEFSVNPDRSEQFEALFEALAERPASQILYAWATPSAAAALAARERPDLVSLDQTLPLTFWGLFGLAKALCNLDHPCTLTVVTEQLWAHQGEPGSPLAAPVLGAVNVLPREAPHITTRAIDLHGAAGASNYAALAAELAGNSKDREVILTSHQRWTRALVPSYEATGHLQSSWVRSQGNYLISGGLGGIGLAVAQHLAKQGAGRIGLLSRSSFPDRGEWSALAASPATDHKLRQQLAALRRIESLGAQVLLLQADVCDPTAVAHAVSQIESKDQIHGVIHAAGVMDDQLLLVKGRESASAVLEAKVRGAIVLDQLFADTSLDFMLLFSSIASFMGLPGQVDYTAANAFLDSLAHQRSLTAPGYTAVVNWSAWRDVGMAAAAAAADSQAMPTSSDQKSVHPALLDEPDPASPHPVWTGALEAARHWFIGEHQIIGGSALIPGTGLTELAVSVLRATAAAAVQKDSILELSEVQFIEALQVPPGTSVPVTVTCAATGEQGSWDLSIYSKDEQAPNLVAEGRLLQDTIPQLDVATVAARMGREQATDGRFLQQRFMQFGPRWGCIDKIEAAVETREALLQLSLSPQLADDLEQHPLHPALLDMATGAAQFLIPDFDADADFYVPYRYEKLRFYKPLERQLCSHVRCTSDAGDAFARFDVTIANPAGQVLVDITGFTMKRLDAGSAMTELPVTATPVSFQNLSLEDILQHAMTPQEGMMALDRLMHRADRCQWIVSSVDTEAWSQALAQDEPFVGADADALTFVHLEEPSDPDAHPSIVLLEAALSALAPVQKAAVRCFGAGDGGGRWVAWVEWRAGAQAEPTRAQVNQQLAAAGCKEQLDGMESVTSWPLASDGSLQRTELLDPFGDVAVYRAPVGATQERLAEIWCTILGAPHIGVDEHFFELGGHSLLLTRLIARVQKAFGRKLPLEAAYETPTIQAWAELLDDQNEPAAPVASIGRANRSQFRVAPQDSGEA